MPDARLSRILQGKKERGNTVAITELDIGQIALALKMGRTGRDKLRYAAWPELSFIDDALGAGETVVGLNSTLAANGLSPLGIDNPKE